MISSFVVTVRVTITKGEELGAPWEDVEEREQQVRNAEEPAEKLVQQAHDRHDWLFVLWISNIDDCFRKQKRNL